MAGDISKKTVMVLLVLAIIFSVTLTLVVLRMQTLKSSQSAEQQPAVSRPTQGANVGVTVVESKGAGEEAGEVGAAAGG